MGLFSNQHHQLSYSSVLLIRIHSIDLKNQQKSTLLTRQCSPKKRDNASRVFSLGFVIVGRSFLIIGKRKEQPFSCVKIAALNRWFTILECQYLNLHGLIAYQKIITKQRADVSKSLINFFTRKIMHC